MDVVFPTVDAGKSSVRAKVEHLFRILKRVFGFDKVAKSVNTRITGIDVYLKWKGENHRLSKLKRTNRVLPIHTREHLEKLLKWKPESARSMDVISFSKTLSY